MIITSQVQHPTSSKTSRDTIRRIPSTPQLPPVPSLPPPAILALSITAQADTSNIDAARGGEVSVLIRVSGQFTQPPRFEERDSHGIDGAILLDLSVPEARFALAKSAALAIVQETSSNDRLGLVAFGSRDANTISDLIMCTAPYKAALSASLSELVPSRPRLRGRHTGKSRPFREGMKSALTMLAKDARFGGHVFLVSDGGFEVDEVFWTGASTTVHIFAVGALIHPKKLRALQHRAGAFIEVRSTIRGAVWGNGGDQGALRFLFGYLRSQTHFHSIETVRCRITIPAAQYVSLVDVNGVPSQTMLGTSSQFSLTLSIILPLVPLFLVVSP